MATTMKYARLDLGTIEAVFNKLGGIDGAGRFLRGDAEVVTTRHMIDCDADPFVPDGWTVEEHARGGQFEWDPTRVRLYLSTRQRDGKVIEGNRLRAELRGRPVLNANVLDYLLAHPQLIPDTWKRKSVMFLGTVYRHADGGLGIRILYWSQRWCWGFRWLGVATCDEHDPTAVLA